MIMMMTVISWGKELQSKLEKDFYLYHQIGEEKYDWFGDESNTPDELIDATKDMQAGDTFNLHINSPGGSIFDGVTMASALQQLEEKGVQVNGYIDGMCASAASFLVMQCDNIYAYNSSSIVIHKPMNGLMYMSNSDELRKEADTLDNILENSNMPLYMKKAKVSEDEIKQMMKEETWLIGDQMADVFDIEMMGDSKRVEKVDGKYKQFFKHAPKELFKDMDTNPKPKGKPSEHKKPKHREIDYDSYRKFINKMEV